MKAKTAVQAKIQGLGLLLIALSLNISWNNNYQKTGSASFSSSSPCSTQNNGYSNDKEPNGAPPLFRIGQGSCSTPGVEGQTFKSVNEAYTKANTNPKAQSILKKYNLTNIPHQTCRVAFKQNNSVDKIICKYNKQSSTQQNNTKPTETVTKSETTEAQGMTDCKDGNCVKSDSLEPLPIATQDVTDTSETTKIATTEESAIAPTVKAPKESQAETSHGIVASATSTQVKESKEDLCGRKSGSSLYRCLTEQIVNESDDPESEFDGLLEEVTGLISEDDNPKKVKRNSKKALKYLNAMKKKLKKMRRHRVKYDPLLSRKERREAKREYRNIIRELTAKVKETENQVKLGSQAYAKYSDILEKESLVNDQYERQMAGLNHNYHRTKTQLNYYKQMELLRNPQFASLIEQKYQGQFQQLDQQYQQRSSSFKSLHSQELSMVTLDKKFLAKQLQSNYPMYADLISASTTNIAKGNGLETPSTGTPTTSLPSTPAIQPFTLSRTPSQFATTVNGTLTPSPMTPLHQGAMNYYKQPITPSFQRGFKNYQNINPVQTLINNPI